MVEQTDSSGLMGVLLIVFLALLVTVAIAEARLALRIRSEIWS